MKDKTFIKALIVMLVLFILLSVYQALLIRNQDSQLEAVINDRDKVIELYNERGK